LAVFAMLASLMGVVAQALVNNPTFNRGAGIGGTSAFFVVSLGLFWMARRGWLTPAALILVTLFVASAVYWDFIFILMATLAVISAAALCTGTVYGLTNIIIFGTGGYSLISQWFEYSQRGEIPPAEFSTPVFALIALAIVTIATRFFIEQAEKAANASREDAALIRAVAETGQAITQVRDRQALLPRAAELIRERLALSQAQIYLVSEDRTRLTRVATTDEAMAASSGTYNLREQPAMSHVVMRGEPILVRQGDDPAYSKLLAQDTASALLLPVIDHDLVIGVLDLQSRRASAFPGDAPRTLGIMASLLGTAMQNALAFEEQERRQQEVRKLFLEAETNLRENQRLNEQLSREGWSQYLARRPEAVGVTLAGDQLRSDTAWSQPLVKASRGRQVVTEQRGRQQVIAVPVTLGGEVIGAIEIESSREDTSQEALETVKAVAQRLATSVDKARLFEETRATAAQEQRINEISSRYQSVSSVDDLLRITLTELSESLGATQGAIRLGKPSLAPENGEAS
jgi:GAF domain-containing protein